MVIALRPNSFRIINAAREPLRYNRIPLSSHGGNDGTQIPTKSFALLVHDPDAPTGGAGWWHWVVVNIPASTTELRKDAGRADGSNLPMGAAQINTDFGSPGWGGPCPPVGDKPHRYNFTLYALKVERLDASGATASLAGYMVNANAIGKARLTGKFGRKK